MASPAPDIPVQSPPDTAIRPDPIPEQQAPPIPVQRDVADLQAAYQHPSGTTIGAAVSDAGEFGDEVVPIIQETRRGWKTSEFWVGIASAISVIATSLPQTDKLLITILGGAYAVARGIAKNGIPNIVPPDAPNE